MCWTLQLYIIYTRVDRAAELALGSHPDLSLILSERDTFMREISTIWYYGTRHQSILVSREIDFLTSSFMRYVSTLNRTFIIAPEFLSEFLSYTYPHFASLRSHTGNDLRAWLGLVIREPQGASPCPCIRYRLCGGVYDPFSIHADSRSSRRPPVIREDRITHPLDTANIRVGDIPPFPSACPCVPISISQMMETKYGEKTERLW